MQQPLVLSSPKEGKAGVFSSLSPFDICLHNAVIRIEFIPSCPLEGETKTTIRDGSYAKNYWSNTYYCPATSMETAA